MNVNLSSLDRRKFLRGAGVALALPWLESFTNTARAASKPELRKRGDGLTDLVILIVKSDLFQLN